MKYADSVEEVRAIKTGTFIDKVTGIGGLPRGRITEIYGDESVGKSTIMFQAIATAQQNKLKCLFVDTEWSYDSLYATSLGVDNSNLGLIRHKHAEDALDEVEEEIGRGYWDLVVLDSVGGLLSRGESEKDAGGKTIGSQAGLMARFCRKIVPILYTTDTALVVLNHIFTDIMTGQLKTSGGKKLAYHKSLSIRLRNKTGALLKQGEKTVGKVIKVSVTKNKVASTEGMEIESRIIFGDGFSSSADLLEDAIEAGIVTKTGNSYFFEGEKLGMISKVRTLLKDDPTFSEKLKALTT